MKPASTNKLLSRSSFVLLILILVWMANPSFKNAFSEDQSDLHIEARVNWDSKNVPKGTPKMGFVPYLYINAKVINEKTGLSTFIDLVPHINLVDNFHYARNISLPGKIDDLYTVIFNVIPPTNMDLSLHKDWSINYGN